MRAGVAAFINASAAPDTPLPPLALTEFQITTAYSGAGNATERLVRQGRAAPPLTLLRSGRLLTRSAPPS